MLVAGRACDKWLARNRLFRYLVGVREKLRLPLSGLVPGERDLDEASSRYLVRVHRMTRGASFVVFDPEARLEADAELSVADPRQARCLLGALRPATQVASVPVVLLQALGKADKPDLVVRDATALGARGIAFVTSVRSVPRLAERATSRVARWHALALEAARQSGRGDIPFVRAPKPLAQTLADAEVAKCHQRLVLEPDAAEALLARLGDWDAREPVALLIGPEGGFDRAELDAACAAGFVPVSFGPLVLRTETAATAALGALVAFAAARKQASKGT
jgi:16S rRNA (uracil1498-N3)-methyltransferase